MLTLVYDTETTGLPPKGILPLKDQPYIIQLAAILYNDRRPVAHFSTFIEPECAIPDAAFWRDNNLTAPEISPSWFPLELSMKMFNQFLRKADRIVAHNAKFDAGRVEDSYLRVLGKPSPEYTSTPQFCTMLSLVDELKIPNKWNSGFKWPTLDEAYRKLIDPKGFTGAHDAMADVMACAEVLFACEDKSIPLVRI